ncbi:hypothetical protein ANCCAN_20584 [Ancylostoma caninum]|uniref:Uncharacterized protein n=1 Tax=Ancylostoma caninum TaxID=29170 RepID=A0A368FMX3_ANCCA|nr:hypothetical protein ANCCAN_20584 [Ancylostoma caninum]
MEAGTASRSPSWKNPRERLKNHLRRTNSNRSLTAPLDNAKKSLDAHIGSQEVIPSSISLVRSNPFKRSSPIKKRRKRGYEEHVSFELSTAWDDSNANDPFSNERVLRSSKFRSSRDRSNVMSSDSSFKESFATDFSDIFIGDASNSTEEDHSNCSEKIPLDLRLGVAVVRMTGQQRQEGLRCFMNTVAVQFNASSELEIPSDVSAIALLESACLFWQFPCFSWLPTYPRADTLVNASALNKHSTPSMPENCLEAVDMQWTECFDQLFLSWKKGDRRSFYMACSSFTVLFTKLSCDDGLMATEDSSSCFQTCGGLRHVVIVTPSTLGFRQYLKSEGVEYEVIRKKAQSSSKVLISFKLPCDEDSLSKLDWSGVTESQPPLFSYGVEYEVIRKKTQSSSKVLTSFKLPCDEDSLSKLDWSGVTESQPPLFSYDIGLKSSPNESHNKENTSDLGLSEESPGKADISGDHEWLENIGMSPRKSAKLRRYKSTGSASNLASEASLNRPDLDDVAAVLGSQVQTLYNLLQSSRVCRSIAGPHANIPPTLISSSPFLHAQLQNLKKSSQVIRKKQSEYVLELDGGPIMPHTIPLVAEFIRRSGVCSEEPVTIRVNDRSVCNGINDVDSELSDWNEIRVDKEKIFWEKT